MRDYAGALQGLNAYRRLTLSGSGPVEAFRVLPATEAFTRSLEEFRRAIGPTFVSDGSRGLAPVAVVVRTRNRPALLAEALASLREQTARPTRVVVVNDGGASVRAVAESFRDAFDIRVEELPAQGGRSAAANRGVELAEEELVAFLDDDDLTYPDHFERLLRTFRSGPEPVVYSDRSRPSTAGTGRLESRRAALQYSLDFDRDYLLLANYIPLQLSSLPRALYGRLGASTLDGVLRGLGFPHPRIFRDVVPPRPRGTCEYRVFETESVRLRARRGGFRRLPTGAPPDLREVRVPSDRGRRVARVLDRMRSQIALWYDGMACRSGSCGTSARVTTLSAALARARSDSHRSRRN